MDNDLTISDKSKIDLKILGLIVGGVLALAGVWGDMRIQIAEVRSMSEQNRSAIARTVDAVTVQTEITELRDEMRRVRDRLDKLLDKTMLK